MKFLFDLFPVILFFIAFKFTDIFVATGVAMVATFVQILVTWFVYRKIESALWASLIIIMVFGAMTLLFHNEDFIKWKPTVLYWFFALALSGSAFFYKKNLIKALLGAKIALPEPVWQRLNLAWIGFFLFMGIANLCIAFVFGLSTETWVNFKLFGGSGLMFLFVIIQGVLLSKYMVEK